VIGRERFEPVPLSRGLSLRQDDELRARGVQWGLGKEIAEWLRSGEETLVLPAKHFA
jgi:ribose 1,5-bisphosphokinase PhnN